MLPALWPGDTVLIEKRAPAQLEPGDVVLYERANRIFLHRLILLGPESMTARGDTLLQSDPPVSFDCLRGVLAGVRRGDEWAVPSKRMPVLWRAVAAVLSRSALALRLFVRVGLKVRGVREEQVVRGPQSVRATLESSH